MKKRLAALIPLFLCLIHAFSADISLHQDFDNGALMVEQSSVSGDWVFLEGPDNYNPGRWKWIYFRADGVQGRELRFRIGNNYATGSSRLSNLRMVYRKEGGEWEFFDHNILDNNAGHFTFYNDAPFTGNSAWVAFSFPYPVERVTEHVSVLKESPWVFPTSSSNDDLILGQSPGGIDDRGRTVGPLPLYGFLITDPSATREKERIVLCGGVHSNEVLGNHVLEGLINWLVSGDPRAAALRRVVEFYVYPMVNPDGRYAGYNRGNVQWPSRDTNRFWREDLYADMDDIRQIAEAMKADTGMERVTWFFDFHSWSNTLDHFVIMNPPARETVFWRELKRLEPAMGESVGNPSTWQSRRFATERLNALFALIPETMFRPGEYPERYTSMGENFGIALFHEINPPGFKNPMANVLMLVEEGHAREADVRSMGAWLENSRPGLFTVDYSADLLVNVLDSPEFLTAEQMDLLNLYDLIVVPPFGTANPAEFGSRDWNGIATPILNMNPATVTVDHWNWMPAADAFLDNPRELVIADLTNPLFEGLDTSAGQFPIHADPHAMTIMVHPPDSSRLSGRVVGWTDHESNGVNFRHPWLVTWDGRETSFYEEGEQAPGGPRLFFAGPVNNIPEVLSEAGRNLLLNAASRALRTRILMLVASGHTAEANVRGMGSWILEERRGRYSLDFSADLRPNVLDSSLALNAAQRDLLHRYDLIIMPRYGVGSAGNFGTRDWNDVSTPLICMNPFAMVDARWGWLPAGTPTSTNPPVRDLVPVDGQSPLFAGLNSGSPSLPMFPEPLSIMQVDLNSILFTGNTIGWTDREANGILRQFPWIHSWAGHETGYHLMDGAESPGGRRMLFLGPMANAPGAFTADGLTVLLNAIDHMSSPLPRHEALRGFQGWRHTHFSSLELADQNISGPGSAAKGDGVANLVKYALGLAPSENALPYLPRVEILQYMEDGQPVRYPTLVIRLGKEIEGLVKRVERSDDLLEWTDETVWLGQEDVDDRWREVVFRDGKPVTHSSQGFLRVRFEQAR